VRRLVEVQVLSSAPSQDVLLGINKTQDTALRT
jgi:hypothetical protein